MRLLVAASVSLQDCSLSLLSLVLCGPQFDKWTILHFHFRLPCYSSTFFVIYRLQHRSMPFRLFTWPFNNSSALSSKVTDSATFVVFHIVNEAAYWTFSVYGTPTSIDFGLEKCVLPFMWIYFINHIWFGQQWLWLFVSLPIYATRIGLYSFKSITK